MSNFLKVLIILIPAIFLSCTDNQKNEVWPPNSSEDAERPLISNIYPDAMTIDADSVTFAGVGIIYIEGQNFSANVNENNVYFNGAKGAILEASTTLLKVRVANVVDDSIKIQLNVKGATLYAEYNGEAYYSPFKTKNAAVNYFAIDQDVDVSGLAVDADENVYVLTTDRDILKISHPDSAFEEWGSAIFVVTPCMRFGPGGIMYVTRGTRSLYTAEAPDYRTVRLLSMRNNISHLDFDENANMFAGGRDGTIELLRTSDGSDSTMASYPDYIVTSLRVFNGYVYISAEYDGDDSLAIMEGIWKNQILDSDGSLGSNELVFDWAAFVGENGPAITAITFDEDGEMYIGQSKDEAIYLLNESRYFYPEILDAPVTTLTWGNSNYLYYNKHSSDATERTLVRIELTKNGAPYYGR